MSFLPGFGRGVLTFVLAIALSAWVWAATAQATIFNRTTVMGWLESSQVYSGFGDVVRAQTSQQNQDSAAFNQQSVQKALANTLTPAFIQQSTETILNATYDWLEGKTQSIEFSLSLADKRQEFQTQLAQAIEPYAASLPKCSANLSSSSTVCLPGGQSAATFAQDYAKRAVESSDFLSQPLTPQAIGQTQQLPSLEPLLLVTRNLNLIVWGLLGVVLLCVAGYILLSADKLHGTMVISRRIFFSVALSAIVGGVLWWFGPQFQLNIVLWDETVTTKLVQPLITHVLPSIGMWLFIFAGSTMGVSGLTWLITFILLKKRAQVPQLATPQPPAPAA